MAVPYECHLDTLTQMLGLVLQTCDQAALHPRAVCALLQTCSGVRSALQQLQGGRMEVLCDRTCTLEQLEEFAEWLPAHAGLVHSLSIGALDDCNYAHARWSMQLVISALESASAALTAAEAAASSGPRLLLRSFSSTYYAGTAALLEALPACSLTQLSLQPAHLDAPFAAALAGLSRLRSLRLKQVYPFQPWPAAGTALCSLTALTCLELHAPVLASALEVLPRGLQQLDARVDSAPAGIDLSGLTRLRELALRLHADGAFDLEGSAQLPAQLTSLQLDCGNRPAVQLLGVTQLSQLQQLGVKNSTDGAAAMQQLGALPQLQGLTLHFWVYAGDAEEHGSLAPPSVSAWPRLPQLWDLSVRMEAMDDDGCEQLLSSVSQLTSLTALVLGGDLGREDYLGPFSLCDRLSGLTQLCMLDLDRVLQPEGSLVHLLPLTRLTMLDVVCEHDGDNVALAALAGRLTGLQSLWLQPRDGGFTLNPTTLRALGSLTGLTQLGFSDYAGIHSTDLSVLHSLTRLTHFGVHLEDGHQPHEDALRAFIAAVSGLADGGLIVNDGCWPPLPIV